MMRGPIGHRSGDLGPAAHGLCLTEVGDVAIESRSVLGERRAEGLWRRDPEVCCCDERRGRGTRAGETSVHLEPHAVLAEQLGEHRRVAAAEVIEVEAFGVKRVGDGSAEHGTILPQPADCYRLMLCPVDDPPPDAEGVTPGRSASM